MKNFTNNFKQFTSRLSARWLIMALMLLLGTSSAWAKYVYLHATGSNSWTKDGANFAVWYWGGGVTNQWSAIATSLGDGYYSVEINDAATDYKWVRVNSSASNWQANKTNWNDNGGLVWNEGGNATYSNGNLYRMNDFNGDKAYKATFSYVFSYGLGNSSWTDKNFPTTITLSINTYEFKVKETLTYNTNNTHTTWLSNSGTMDRNNHEGWTMYADVSQNCKITADVSGTYTFTFDETTKKLSVEYPSACSTPELSDFTYTLPDDDNTKAGNEVMWNGNTRAATVKWSGENSTAGITIYYTKTGGSKTQIAPSDVGTYTVTIETTAQGDFCATKSPITLGTFTITCPTPTTPLEISYTNVVRCGGTTKTHGTITINNYSVYGENTNFYLGSTLYEYSEIDEMKGILGGIEFPSKDAENYYVYVEQKCGSSVSEKLQSKQITLTATDITPAAPNFDTEGVSVCLNTQVTLPTIQGKKLKWYDAATGGNVVEKTTFTATVNTDYYAVVVGDCESARTKYSVTIKTKPTVTLNPTSNTVCSSSTINNIEDYVTVNTTGSQVSWYSEQSGGEALAGNTPLEATTYYAEAMLDGCPSDRASFGITAVLNAPSAPVIKANKNAVCSGESVELTLEYNIVGETYKINDSKVFTDQSTTWTSLALNSTTEYVVTAYNSCGSTDSEKLTINVTTTPVITGVTVTTPNKPVTLTSSVENTVWSYNGGSLSSSEGKTVAFTASSTGEYIITAKNKDNVNCSASVTVYVRESLYYIYIRRPKNGETDKNYDAYGYWYEFSNNDQKGGASWFKEGEAGSGIGTNDEAKDPNYGGYAPEFSFEDCNDYIWDAFAPANLTTNYKFHVHAPNGSDSKGHATFTQTTTISSMNSDLYYKIKKWDDKSQGVVLTQVTGNNIPTPRPEVVTPIISMEPIICSGTNAIVEITNPQNGVTYTLTYNGEKQGDPISYNGSNEVKFSVNQAGTYMVNAETTEGTCKGSATSRGENLQIITTSVSFSQSEYTTTPWIPVTVKINVPKGYSYTYTDTDITSISPAENAPVRKVNGTEITYTFPRPNAEGTVDPWGIGNTTGDGWGEKVYQVEATITGAPDACDSAIATVKLQDEGNDKCTNP